MFGPIVIDSIGLGPIITIVLLLLFCLIVRMLGGGNPESLEQPAQKSAFPKLLSENEIGLAAEKLHITDVNYEKRTFVVRTTGSTLGRFGLSMAQQVGGEVEEDRELSKSATIYMPRVRSNVQFDQAVDRAEALAKNHHRL